MEEDNFLLPMIKLHNNKISHELHEEIFIFYTSLLMH
jgi:hypothetical protein